MSFKVGDLIEIVDSNNTDLRKFIGHVGVILRPAMWPGSWIIEGAEIDPADNRRCSFNEIHIRLMSDKRKVSTDALETLGTIIGPNEKRDAIHLAVLPIEAAYHLKPGEHVRIDDDGRAVWGFADDAIGIVDPFLKQPVKGGERFWLVIYPRVINSLRHVWTHPRIADELSAGPVKIVGTESDEELLRLESKNWLSAYAVALFSYYGIDYDEEGERKNDTAEARASACLDYLIENVESGYFGTDIEYGESLAPTEELWMHFERYTGRKPESKPEHFRCAC